MTKLALHPETLELIEQAHGVQQRRGVELYYNHPRRVAQSVLDKYQDQDLANAALLHDVLEDTSLTEKQLRKKYNDRTVATVLALTKVKNEEKNKYLERVLNSRDATLVKLEDLNDNIAELPGQYWPGMEEAIPRYKKTHAELLAEAKKRGYL